MPKEKAKSKPKRVIRRFSWRKALIIGSAAFVLYIVYLILSPIPFNPAIITQTSLPDDLRPFAEEIFSTVPIRESIRVTDDISLRLEVWEYALYTEASHSICIKYFISENTPYDRFSHIFVNGQKVNGITFGLEYLDVLEGTTSFSRCAEGNLDTGLHLIEFHLRDSAWGEPVAIQRWAIEIE